MKYTIHGPFRTTHNKKPFLIEGSITIEQNSIVEEPRSAVDSKYELTYTKLNGNTNKYKLKSIDFMNGSLMKATVCGKGFRSFRTERIVSLLPILT